MEQYPFRLGATSLTNPMQDVFANIDLNVRLGLKSIEVTLEFPQTLPVDRNFISKLVEYKEKYELDYTIHLPLSLRMTDVNPFIRDASLKTLEEIFAAVGEIQPLAYILHVTPMFKTGGTPLGRPFEVQLHEHRLNAVEDTLSRLKDMIEPRLIAVENLYSEFEFLDEYIKKYEYSVCMDVGHLLLHRADVYLFYHRYKERIKVIHLHDVVNGKDHQQLGESNSLLDLPGLFHLLRQYNYQETIILEQFKVKHIQQSQHLIKDIWDQLSM